MLKFSGSVIWRLGTRAPLRKYSSAGATVVKTESTRAASDPSGDSKDSSGKGKGLVAAAFASLNSPEDPTIKPSLKSVKQSKNQMLDGQISNATDVDTLLVVAENAVVSRRHALKMVSILSDWSSNNKVKLGDFEKDPRFLKLCRILARTPTAEAMSSLTMAEDLSTVLGITGDDEAARLITNLTLPQMIKVMKALHQKGRRSTPLLRALSHNINKQPDVIDLKKSADLLFSMSALNFPDPVLMDRICNDIIECLPLNKDKSAVVTSIMVSLGLMKYRHEAVLTAITDWVHNHKDVVRPTDIASTVTTLATVDFIPANTEELFQDAIALKEEEMAKSSMWLDLVFSLLVLNKAKKWHLDSTLRSEFIDKLLSIGEIPIPSRRKLALISAARGEKGAGAAGRTPAPELLVGVPLQHGKDKAHYVHCLMETFNSLVSAETFLRKELNSQMGFLFDAEFAVDSKCHPVPLEKAANNKSVHRIAVLGLDYHDMTRKTVVPLGINQLYTRLLQLKGYKVLQVPYTEFNPKDKLVTRVSYIEKRLKELISDKTASA